MGMDRLSQMIKTFTFSGFVQLSAGSARWMLDWALDFKSLSGYQASIICFVDIKGSLELSL